MRRAVLVVLAALLPAGACGRGDAAQDGGSRAGAGGTVPHSDSAPPPGAMPQGISAEVGAEGRRVYASTCIACHGEDGRGTQLGPSIADGEWRNVPGGSFEEIATLVRQGVPQPEEYEVAMPAYAGYLTEEQIRAVAAYTYSLGH